MPRLRLCAWLCCVVLPSEGPQAPFRAYLAALNRHDVEGALAFYAPAMVSRRLGERTSRSLGDLRDIRAWEAPLQARFDADASIRPLTSTEPWPTP